MHATTSDMARGSVSVVEWLQHALHPWTSYLIVPLFALANSGIEISIDGLRTAARSPITWGIVFGLVIGKPLGIMIATRLAVRSGLADGLRGTTSRQTVGVGTAAGIGFTVALFITDLAFTDEATQSTAKLAVLVSSIVAAFIALVLLRFGPRPNAQHRTLRAPTVRASTKWVLPRHDRHAEPAAAHTAGAPGADAANAGAATAR